MGELLVAAIGAVIVIASTMVTGWRLHVWALRHGFGAWLPKDTGAIAGLVVGAITVARWIVSP